MRVATRACVEIFPFSALFFSPRGEFLVPLPGHPFRQFSLQGSAQLVLKNSDITIMGHGKADISPRDEAEITVMGEGTVNLLTEPKSVNTHIMGSGRIIHAAKDKAPI